MGGRFWMSVVAMFVMSMAIGFFVHGTVLNADYKALGSLFRPEADQMRYFPAMLAAHVFLAVGFTWIYLRGREAGKPFLGQGLRYGVAVAVLSTVPTYLIYLAVQPMPEVVVAKQIVLDTIGLLAMGVVVAAINRA